MNESKSSFKNKPLLFTTIQCGCYYCLNIFPTSTITHWVDNEQTAICPHCSIDSVIPFQESNFKETLENLNKQQFNF